MDTAILVMFLLLPNGSERVFEERAATLTECHSTAAEMTRRFEGRARVLRYECQQGTVADPIPMTKG